METRQFSEKLNENLKDMVWSYNLDSKGEVVRFRNMETDSIDEEQFLESLEEEGSERTIKGEGDLFYKFVRKEGKIQLSLVRGDKRVGKKTEVEDQEALRLFRENKQGSKQGVLENLSSLFKIDGQKQSKELVPNNISIKVERIENIKSREGNTLDSVEIKGNNFTVELREDGGCSISFI